MSAFGLNQHYIKLSGINLYCEHLINDKPPILLIHGFVSSMYTFRRIIPLLMKQYSIIAVDLPGFGKSEKSTSFIYTLENYATLMLECVKHFGIPSINIAAHSMGGQIALHMARIAPEKVNRLVLLCSSGYINRAKRPLIYSSYLPFFEKFVRYYVGRKDVRAELRNVFFNQHLIDEELVLEFGKPLAEKDFCKALIRLLRHREEICCHNN